MGDLTQDAHMVVRRLVRELKEGVAADRERALGELAAVLPRHFAEEEAPGGFLDELAAHVDHPLQVVALREQHATLLAELEAVRALPGDAREAGLKRFVAALAEHEWNESRLAAEPSLLSGA